MRHIFIWLSATLLVVALLVGSMKLFYSKSTFKSTESHEDGSIYIITNVGQYYQTPAEPAPEDIWVDTLSTSVPIADAIHFSDISGDYLFVKNRYEMYWMLYTLSQSREQAPDIQLTIPEDVVPVVLESWDPDRILEFQCSHTGKICCLESWDIYKNGSYLKTVYLAAAI